MDEETVRRVARVARIDLTDEEITKHAVELNNMLSAFKILDDIPLAEISEIDPITIEDHFRDDAVQPYPDPSELRREMRTVDGWVRGPRLK